MKREIVKIRLLLLGFALLGIIAFIVTAKYTHAAQNYSSLTKTIIYRK